MSTATVLTSNPEYDAIGKLFKSYEGKPAHRVETRTIFNLVGDAAGKSVLDLACGYGYFGRELLKKGAAKVVGVDLSEAMIDLAREESRKNGDSITFYVGDVSELGMLGAFDIAVAAFLFNYAPGISELENMFASVADNLKPGGRLAAYTVEPDYDITKGNFKKYGVNILSEDPWQGGHRMRAEFDTPVPSQFTFYRWSRADYERAIRKAGFTHCEWHKPTPNDADIAAHPEGFWDVYRNNCFHTALLCEK